MLAAETGFWGVPTATVDWCETNYAHLSFVCEFFNSVSSLAMVGAGVVGLVLHRHVLERRLLAAFALVSAVGLGSIAFHMTLRFELQMLDELPMLYLALLMVHLLVENRARAPVRDVVSRGAGRVRGGLDVPVGVPARRAPGVALPGGVSRRSSSSRSRAYGSSTGATASPGCGGCSGWAWARMRSRSRCG